jgi:toxin ParE1/3/4
VRIAWSQIAVTDREQFITHVASDSPHAARVLDARVESAVDRLSTFPESGRPGRVPGTRELIVGGTPVVVIYRVAADEIRIVRVLHGARRWPEQSR